MVEIVVLFMAAYLALWLIGWGIVRLMDWLAH
jgi:hypothetical protein